MSRSGLGKGLGALIPQNFDDTLLVDVNERIQQIAISDIIPNPDQPRKTFDEDSLRELADSIQTHGILQPLVVSPSGQAYQIIAGERRWRAAGLAGLKKVPVIVRSAPVHPACLEAVGVTAAALEGLGHAVDVAAHPYTGDRWESFRTLWTTGAASIPLPDKAEPRLVPLTRWLREQGRRTTGVDYARAVVEGQRVAREVATAWAAFDVVVCPTLAQPPALVGSQRDDADPAADFAAQVAFTPWTSLWNLTGAPAVSLPLHWARVPGAAGELPIGVMLGGRTGDEERLLALAAQLEEALPWRDRRPPVW